MAVWSSFLSNQSILLTFQAYFWSPNPLRECLHCTALNLSSVDNRLVWNSVFSYFVHYVTESHCLFLVLVSDSMVLLVAFATIRDCVMYPRRNSDEVAFHRIWFVVNIFWLTKGKPERSEWQSFEEVKIQNSIFPLYWTCIGFTMKVRCSMVRHCILK